MGAQDTFFSPKSSLNCGGKLVSLEQPLVMGIINLTPDSFYDGGKHNTIELAISRTEQILFEGGKLIDLGAVSSRPGAQAISEKEELERLIPVLTAIEKAFPEVIVSVDTYRSNVAQAAVEHGAAIINDISGGNMDSAMFETIARLKVPYVLMHMQGTPDNMQDNPSYQNVEREVLQYLRSKLQQLTELGVHDVIVDPGFGFGKTLEHNYRLLKHLDEFRVLKAPLLVGVSRKSMINKLLKTNPETAGNGTSILHTIALQKGANILRTHDVKEAVQAIQIVDYMKNI